MSVINQRVVGNTPPWRNWIERGYLFQWYFIVHRKKFDF